MRRPRRSAKDGQRYGTARHSTARGHGRKLIVVVVVSGAERRDNNEGEEEAGVELRLDLGTRRDD